ncbi:hypothetical protein AMR47_01395 [Leptospira interrogans]|nr:hypothetical protein AMR47_01395 [Leptospira interrogans]
MIFKKTYFNKDLVPKLQRFLRDNSLKFLIKCSSSYIFMKLNASLLWPLQVAFDNFRAVLISLNFRSSSHILVQLNLHFLKAVRKT